MKRNPKPVWPAIAVALGGRLPLAALHPAPLRAALAGRGARGWAVAFSGGADSLALLLALWAHYPARRAGMVAIHFNHRLRGRASDADEKFCRAVCATLGVKFVSARWKAVGRALRPTVWRKARPTVSEAAARAARHAFFAREMKRRRIRLLWLGQQQDDIAETMLMRLARGSGTGGLAAPRPVQEQADGRVHVRPLLTLKKAEIVDALCASGAVWREDATNAGSDYFRNRVRRAVLPAWARAAGRDALAGAALARERLEEDDAALESWLEELAPLRRGALDLTRLTGKPVSLWRRALHRWLLAVQPATDLSRQGFDQLLAAVRRGCDTRFSLGAKSFAVQRAGKLVLRRA